MLIIDKSDDIEQWEYTEKAANYIIQDYMNGIKWIIIHWIFGSVDDEIQNFHDWL